MSQLQELANEDCEMEMTPMIDVTFLLLIFFMCTLKFKTLEGKLAAYLPKDVGVNPTPAVEPPPKAEVRIDVVNEGNKVKPQDGTPYTGKGRYVYDGTRKVAYRLGPRKLRDAAELKRELKKWYDDGVAKSPDDPPKGTIDPRKGVIYSDVVQVLDMFMDAQFTDITFVGTYED